MAGKKRLFLILLVLVSVIPPLFGQEGEEGSFHIERTEEGERFIQRLLWDEVEYARRYEVWIEEQNSAGVYTEILRESREENFIELSLAPGSYRSRIQAYNILNRPSENSEWTYFRVLPALQPELYSFTQDFPPSPEGVTEIVVQGRNLQEGADWYLVSPESAASPIRPGASLSQEQGARLVFSTESLPPGQYRVYVRNPGGLESSLEITVAFPPPIAAAPDAVTDTGAPPEAPALAENSEPDDSAADDTPAEAPALAESSEPDNSSVDDTPAEVSALTGSSEPDDSLVDDTPADTGAADDSLTGGGLRLWSRFISAEYAPLIPLYGYLFDHFDQGFYPTGVSLRFGVLPIKKSWGDIGLEAAPYWAILKTNFEGIRQTTHLGTLHLNGIYQKQLPIQIMTLTLRLGGGIYFVNGINENDQESESVFTWMPSISGGISLKWFAYKSFYIETGADYTHIFSEEPPPGFIKLFLGLGWLFI
jgi:hypothetical protein